MADKTNRFPINAPGRCYVDDSCIDCGLCREIAPLIFARDDASGYSFVMRQPASEEEIVLAEKALSDCPTESIGNDGDR